MGFLTFIWNALMRIIGFFGFIFLEFIIFSVIFFAISPILPGFSIFLLVVFIIWLVVEIFLRLFVGGGVTLFKYLFGRFF